MTESLFQQPNFVSRTPCKLNSTQGGREGVGCAAHPHATRALPAAAAAAAAAARFMNDRVLHSGEARAWGGGWD
jgi:hypothetical protein